MERKFLKIILIIITAVVILALIVIGFSYLKREYEISKLPDYYRELAKECKKDNLPCCMISVEMMAGGNYKLVNYELAIEN